MYAATELRSSSSTAEDVQAQAHLQLQRAFEASAGDVMNPHPLVVDGRTPVSALKALFTGHPVDTLPVLDGAGRLAGLVHRQAFARRQTPEWHTASDVMHPMRYGVPPEAPLGFVAALLGHGRLPGVAVVDGRGRVIGVIEDADLLCWIGAHGVRPRVAAGGERG